VNSTSSMQIAATALTAQRLRMDVISSNIAHAETTRTPNGGPYRRNRVVFSEAPQASQFQRAVGRSGLDLPRMATSGPSTEASIAGVIVSGIVEDPSPPRLAYDPSHPDADDRGYVAYPNIDITTEMADMLSATRAYEANVTVVNASKGMALKALDIGRG